MTEALAPRLVSAFDIARFRLDGRPHETGTMRMLNWYTEVQQAKAELDRGEWVLPEPSA